jgi:hypothetical protein
MARSAGDRPIVHRSNRDKLDLCGARRAIVVPATINNFADVRLLCPHSMPPEFMAGQRVTFGFRSVPGWKRPKLRELRGGLDRLHKHAACSHLDL